jgi:hypothetical protein
MKHFCDEWIKEWCAENGWTDLSVEHSNFCCSYWAFPPGAVMPEPIPQDILRTIKSQKGLSPEERFWLILASISTVLSTLLCYLFKSPMPFIFAFAFDAFTVVRLEVEYF